MWRTGGEMGRDEGGVKFLRSSTVKQGRPAFCEQKEAKKLWFFLRGAVRATQARSGADVFLVLFFKKDLASTLSAAPPRIAHGR
jgi:hypothetical protein